MGYDPMGDLIFIVDRLPVEGISGQRILEPSWFSLPPETDDPIHPIRIQDPILVDFRLEPSGGDVRARVAVTTTASLTCARCLKAFSFPVKARTNFTFCRVSHPSGLEAESHLNLEDLETGTLEGDEIDLSGLVYEQIVLSFPIKPLCHEGCKGLCPQCGADLNTKACGCRTRRVDPRWEALGKLKLGL